MTSLSALGLDEGKLDAFQQQWAQRLSEIVD
jgi:hypothetical protein